MSMQAQGIPAAVVVKFLSSRRIEIEKTGLYSFLVLFSMGITKGKWSTLITELLNFKELYDANRPLDHVLPDLAAYRDLIVELDGQPIGDLMLRVSDAWAQSEVAGQARGVQAELGWCLHPAQQGHGYAVEAVRALVSVCFGQLGIRRIEANCFADNEPSWRLMERLGMRREMHAVSESLHRNGEWLDGYTYALLASDWKPAEITN